MKKPRIATILAPSLGREHRRQITDSISSPSAPMLLLLIHGLLALRPPMVHTPGKRDMERGNLSVIRLMVWSTVAALLALVVPMLWKRR